VGGCGFSSEVRARTLAEQPACATIGHAAGTFLRFLYPRPSYPRPGLFAQLWHKFHARASTESRPANAILQARFAEAKIVCFLRSVQIV